MDLACLHIRGLPTTTMVPWPRECVTPGREVWGLSLTPSGGPESCAEGDHTLEVKEKGRTHVSFTWLVFRNRCFTVSIYTELCLFPLYPWAVPHPWGSWRPLRWATWQLFQFTSKSMGRRGQVYLGNWLQGTWISKKPLSSRWGCNCVLLPVDIHTHWAETRPAPPLPVQHLVCFHRIAVG